MTSAARLRPVRPPDRGFSLPAFLVTLVVSLLVVAAALYVVDRTTKIPPPPARPRVEAALDAAVRALKRDVTAAISGFLPPGEACYAMADNLPAGRLFGGPFGDVAVARPGTDVLGLRGILRSPLLRLDGEDRETGRPFSRTPGTGEPGEIQTRPSAARLKVYGYSGESRNDGLPAVLERLRARPLSGPARRFFAVKDTVGVWAVALVVGFEAASIQGCEGPEASAAARSACFVELTLDFSAAEAARLNPAGDAAAPSRLGTLTAGGLFDEIAYFVARGPAGRPPDYLVVTDPLSMANPRPFLAAAESAGGGTWDIVRVAEDVENLQVAYAGVGADGGEVWSAARAGDSLPAPGEGNAGSSGWSAIRVAVVAIGPRRPRGSSLDLSQALPLNAPPPDTRASPIGWAFEARNQIPLERALRVVDFRLPAAR